MGESPSKEHWQNCYGMRVVKDDLLDVDAIIDHIIFLWVCCCWSHFTYTERKRAFFGPLLKEKQELGGTGFINKACILYKRLQVQCCKLSKNSDVASSAKWKNHALNIDKSLWFSGLGAGLSPCSHGFNPWCINVFFFFFCSINYPCSSFIGLNP